MYKLYVYDISETDDIRVTHDEEKMDWMTNLTLCFYANTLQEMLMLRKQYSDEDTKVMCFIKTPQETWGTLGHRPEDILNRLPTFLYQQQ